MPPALTADGPCCGGGGPVAGSGFGREDLLAAMQGPKPGPGPQHDMLELSAHAAKYGPG